MSTTDTDTLTERIAEKMRESLTHKYGAGSDLEAPRTTRDGMVSQMGGHIDVPHLAEEVMVIVEAEVRKAKAEAFDSFCNALADHLDLGTPRAWGFHHPCDPPGVRWEPTERDRALMDVADMIRNDTLNPYRATEHETGDSDDLR